MENDKKGFLWQKIDNNIKQVLTALSDSIQTEEEDRYGGIARAIAREYNRDEREMAPDTFAALISYDIVEKLHNQLTLKFFPQYASNKKLLFAIQHYRFLKRHIEDMIAEKSCCPADVSRWLIKQYIAYLEAPSKLPDMAQSTPDGRACFWKPSFGTGEEWMAFCASLEELYYGHSETFFSTRDKLLPNDPLTLDELRKTNGEPVWLTGVSSINNFKGHWDICDWENGEVVSFPYCAETPCINDYGITWLAYRRKPDIAGQNARESHDAGERSF